jgi:hypothetical protein
MNDSIIQILHHNRDRQKLINQIDDYIKNMMNTTIAISLYHFNVFYDFITPFNEAQVVVSNYKQYIDEDIAINDTSCIYSMEQSSAVIQDMHNNLNTTSCVHNSFLKEWLNKRGVEDDQILKYGLMDLSHINKYNMFEQNATGGTIHPALRHWIKDDASPTGVPSGIMTPVVDLWGNIVGCHNRFLSTVPKIKFASSIPNFHLFTNLRINSKPIKIFIVEGVFDALAIDKMNPNYHWIAPSTGFWTEEQLINLLFTISHFNSAEIICAFDNDRVGLKSNIILAKTLLKTKYNVNIMNFKNIEAKDPAEAINKYKMTEDCLAKIDIKVALEKFINMPYEPFKKFEDYLDNRHASYSIDNYHWSE